MSFETIETPHEKIPAIEQKRNDKKCENCQKDFTHFLDLFNHIKTVHPETITVPKLKLKPELSIDKVKTKDPISKFPPKDLKCKYCQKYFIRFIDLFNHIKSIHPETINVRNLECKLDLKPVDIKPKEKRVVSCVRRGRKERMGLSPHI